METETRKATDRRAEVLAPCFSYQKRRRPTGYSGQISKRLTSRGLGNTDTCAQLDSLPRQVEALNAEQQHPCGCPLAASPRCMTSYVLTTKPKQAVRAELDRLRQE